VLSCNCIEILLGGLGVRLAWNKDSIIVEIVHVIWREWMYPSTRNGTTIIYMCHFLIPTLFIFLHFRHAFIIIFQKNKKNPNFSKIIEKVAKPNSPFPPLRLHDELTKLCQNSRTKTYLISKASYVIYFSISQNTSTWWFSVISYLGTFYITLCPINISR
jgi:hypothetical protein